MKKPNAHYRYEIIARSGAHRSYHRTSAAAERQLQRTLAWRCGICGSKKGGWGACSHGGRAQVCSAEHYNDKILHIATSRGDITPECGACHAHTDKIMEGLCPECAGVIPEYYQ